MRMVTAVVVVAALASTTPAATARDLEIASTWAVATVPVDGLPGNWAALMRPLGDPPLVIGVQNDARNLYVCVRTSDPIVKRELQRLGLTVWVNGEGKDRKRSGVCFPVAPAERREGQPVGEEPPQGAERGRTSRSRGARAVELIGPGAKDRRRVQPGPDSPVQAALGDDAGVLVLQFQIPLAFAKGSLPAVEAAPGAVIAVGLATEVPARKGGGRIRFGGGHWGSDERGGYDRTRGDGRGDEGGNDGRSGRMTEGAYRAAPPAPFDIWLRVRLAAAAPPPVSH